MGVTAAVAVGAAMIGYQNVQSHQANDRAQAASDKAEAQQNKLLEDQKKQQEDAQNASAQRSAARQAQLNSTATPGASTIMTSPLGVVNPGSGGGGKTLLGT